MLLYLKIFILILIFIIIVFLFLWAIVKGGTAKQMPPVKSKKRSFKNMRNFEKELDKIEKYLAETLDYELYRIMVADKGYYLHDSDLQIITECSNEAANDIISNIFNNFDRLVREVDCKVVNNPDYGFSDSNKGDKNEEIL